ncbi:MAG: TolC family protein [Flavobacteriales bacterium]|nr:TolC family protein [Flavobacteriales bacterium]
MKTFFYSPFSIFLLLLGTATHLHAQERLTLKQAMEIALENNFEVRVARAEAGIAANNATIGNAGMLPSVGINASQQNAIDNTRQEFITGNVQEVDAAESYNFNTGAQLNWTLFDGLAMFTTHQQLKKLQQQGEANVRTAMQQTLHEVVMGYYGIVRQRQGIALAEATLELSEERVRLENGRMDAGRGSRVTLLQAEVDRNADASLLMQRKQEVFAQQTELNLLLGRNASTAFVIASDTITLSGAPDLAKLRQSLMEQNPELGAGRLGQEAALLQLKTTRRQRWPLIDANVGYGYQNSSSEAGFLASRTNHGLSYGLGTSINLFNGMEQRRLERNAKAVLEVSQLRTAQLELELDGALITAFSDYAALMEQLDLATLNLDAAKRSTELSLERFRQGMLTGIELRDTQLAQTRAADLLTDLLYRAKLTEAMLQRLAGKVEGLSE